MSLTTLRTALYDVMNVPSGEQSALHTSALLAFNHARQNAEKLHDFALAKGVGYLSVAATTGTSLADALAGFTSEAPSGDEVSFKSVESADVRSTTPSWVPASYMTKAKYDARMQRSDRQTPYMYSPTTNDPYTGLAFETRNVLYWYGNTVFTPSETAVTARLYGVLWLPEYEDWDADDDFLITYGSEYMLWYAALWLNNKKQTWIPRKEGSLLPPDQNLQNAWNALLLWDEYKSQTPLDILAGE